MNSLSYFKYAGLSGVVESCDEKDADFVHINDYQDLKVQTESAFAKLLPKEPLYLDPPDGGSVSVEEQLRRYIQALKNENVKLHGYWNEAEQRLALFLKTKR
jgi:hypothetical protein